MLILKETVKAWEGPDFEPVLKAELQAADKSELPLQQGLEQSDRLADSPINMVLLNASDCGDVLQVKAGIFYAGVLSGSCCADDPTPVPDVPEYCEVQLAIDKQSGEAQVRLL